MFVGAGHDGVRIVSADGLEWKNRQIGKEGEIYRAVCFGAGLCVAAGSYGGSNLFAASRDGVTWKTTLRDAAYSRYVRGLVFARGVFFGLGGDGGSVGASHPFETHTTDGSSWTDYREISGKHLLRRAAFGAGRVVGVGDRGRRAVSTDGVEWKDLPDAKAVDTLVDVAFGNGVFVGVGLHGLRMWTEDGLTWKGRQVGEEGEHLNSIVWAGDDFVAVGMGATYRSADGRTWRRFPNHNAPLTAAYGEGVFVGASWKGRLSRSSDAVEWKEVFRCEHHIEAVAFGKWG